MQAYQTHSQKPPRQHGDYVTENFEPINITTNHFEVNLKEGITNVAVFNLHINSPAEVKNDKELHIIWEKVKSQVEERLKIPFWFNNGIYSLESSEEFLKPFEVKTDQDCYTVSQREVYNISNQAGLRQFLDVFLSRGKHVDIDLPQKRFTPEETFTIQYLEMFKGFSSTLQECEKGMFLRVDTARNIVRKGTVLDFINEINEAHPEKDNEEKRNELRKALKDDVVMTNYGKSTFYRVVDVSLRSMMEVPISKEIPNLKDYYRRSYNLDIRHEGQPLLLVENKIQRRGRAGTISGPIYLIPELCSLASIPNKLDEQTKKYISELTILNPKDEQEAINSFMRELGERRDLTWLNQLGINIRHQINRVQARQIPNPILDLGNKYSFDLNRGDQSYKRSQLISSVKKFPKLLIIHDVSFDPHSIVREIKDNLKLNNLRQTEDVKMQKALMENGAQGIVQALRYQTGQFNFLLIILPNQFKNLYSKIKQQCLRKNGILNHVVLEETLQNGHSHVPAEIFLDIAAKWDNLPWVVINNKLRNVLDKTLILGIDSSSKDGKTCLSAVGMVHHFTFQLLSSTTVTVPTGGDKGKDMIMVVSKCVEKYKAKNKCPPEQLIIFMLAVPGNQVNLVQENFCRRLEETVREAHPGSNMRLTCVMVNLRNSERFFSAGQEAKNVPPGTLINAQVVSKHNDFFIVSHQSTKGSIVPTYYRVIHSSSNSKLEEGHLQELIYSQCFNYANWYGSIKIPAILQYAKECAKFNADVMKGMEVDPSLLTRPYFT